MKEFFIDYIDRKDDQQVTIVHVNYLDVTRGQIDDGHGLVDAIISSTFLQEKTFNFAYTITEDEIGLELKNYMDTI